VPVDADGTILVTVKKFNQVSGVTTNLTAAFDLEALVALKPADIPLLSTLTEVQQTLQEGEIIIADVVNNSAAIDTQPKDLTFSAEILILE
jgi:ABC-type Fe3+-hydroxamate transport system substrate-binding protein